MPNDSDPVVPVSKGRTGVMVGILVAVLLALAFFFYWRQTGFLDESGKRPPPPRDTSLTAPAAPSLSGFAVA